MCRSRVVCAVVLSVLFTGASFGQTTVGGLEARIAKLEKRLASVEAQLARISNAGTPPQVTIGTFNQIPDEFGIGAGCSYSTTRNGKPVFIEDMGGSAVMMLNGKTVKLKLSKQSKATGGGVTNIYASNDFEVSKTTTSIRTGPESTSEEGYITVKAKDGGVTKQRIYGDCGA